MSRYRKIVEGTTMQDVVAPIELGDLTRLYRAGKEPGLVAIPDMLFAGIDGEGSPDEGDAFQEAIAALYAFSYTAKFALKKLGVVWKVLPLEGLWWTIDDTPLDHVPRETWRWRLMIAQPPELDVALRRQVMESIAAKPNASPRVSDLRVLRYEEGLAVQILHVGPYETEPASIARMFDFIGSHNLIARGRHHEIYLSDPRRAAPERMKTILRQPVTLSSELSGSVSE